MAKRGAESLSPRSLQAQERLEAAQSMPVEETTESDEDFGEPLTHEQIKAEIEKHNCFGPVAPNGS